MLHFPQRKHSAPHLYAEETDVPLPDTLNPKLRYAYFSTIATGGKSLIQSCRDLYLRRTVCYKTLKPEYRKDPIENLRLLREARIFSQVPDGIGDADCVIAVTARQRSIAAAPAIYPRDLARVLATLSHPADLREEVTGDGGMVPAEQRRRGLAVMFGSERSGLTSEQLDSVNFLLLIPALPGFGSLNLSHAVAVVAYELWLARGLTPTLPHLPHLLPDEQKGVDKKTEDRTRERADSAPRRALICWVERLGRALRERGYREEVNDSQRQRVQEVL